MIGGCRMYALLILGDDHKNAKIIVNLRKNNLKIKVSMLLHDNRKLAAFNLLKNEADVKAYLHPGANLPFMPDIVLIEDLL